MKNGRKQHSLGGVSTVADPDLQVRGRGSQKKFFHPFQHQFGLKIRGALPWIRHWSIKGELTVLGQAEYRGTQREYSSKPLKHSIVKRILVFKQ